MKNTPSLVTSSLSQGNQDIIISNIFKKIGTTNKFCVEFGFNSTDLEGGTGSNTANLIINNGWNGLLLDGDSENLDINLHRHHLTTGNICKIFKQYRVPIAPDYISIDVDSTDLWLYRATLEKYRPRLVSVEYNANFSIDEAITFPNDAREEWQGDKGYGASLKALKLVGDKFGYSLIAIEKCLDLFFVRNDLWDMDSVPSLEHWGKYCLLTPHKPLRNPERVNIFMDYEVYMKTNGDIEESKRGARNIAELRLT